VMENPLCYARLLNHIGCNYWFMADFRTAQSILEESRLILTELGADGEQELGVTLLWLGLTVRSLNGTFKEAQVYLEKSLEIHRKYEDEWNIAYALLHLGSNTLRQNEDAETYSLLTQSLDLFRQLGDQWGMGFAMVILGEFFEKKGDLEKARSLFEQYLSIQETLHFKQGLTHALIMLGEFHKERGEFDLAEQIFQKSLRIAREYDLQWSLCDTLDYLGLLAFIQNEYQRAKHYFTNAYEYARNMYSEEQSASDLLPVLAVAAADANQTERTVKLYGATQAILETTEYKPWKPVLSVLDHYIQIAREQLGNEKFEELMAQGKAMTMEQAVEYALEGQDD